MTIEDLKIYSKLPSVLVFQGRIHSDVLKASEDGTFLKLQAIGIEIKNDGFLVYSGAGYLYAFPFSEFQENDHI